MLAVGPLVANHFGARFALLAWSGAGILRRGRPPSLFPVVLKIGGIAVDRVGSKAAALQ